MRHREAPTMCGGVLPDVVGAPSDDFDPAPNRTPKHFVPALRVRTQCGHKAFMK